MDLEAVSAGDLPAPFTGGCVGALPPALLERRAQGGKGGEVLRTPGSLLDLDELGQLENRDLADLPRAGVGEVEALEGTPRERLAELILARPRSARPARRARRPSPDRAATWRLSGRPSFRSSFGPRPAGTACAEDTGAVRPPARPGSARAGRLTAWPDCYPIARLPRALRDRFRFPARPRPSRRSRRPRSARASPSSRTASGACAPAYPPVRRRRRGPDA